jgi:Zn-dependent metalloprotease
MNHGICAVVPPYLLAAIASSEENDEELRASAHQALQFQSTYAGKRQECLEALAAPQASGSDSASTQRQGIVPGTLLQHIAESEDVDDETRGLARRDLEHYRKLEGQYLKAGAGQEEQKPLAAAAAPETTTFRAVYDARNSSDEDRLPGAVVRVEGQKPTGDEAADEAYDNCGKVLEFYSKFFDWKSIDNKNMQVICTVHFGKKYENAFWTSELKQMVFGDGNTFLNNFTGCIDVIGHELTHAVVEHTSPLIYRSQSGALNEHVADVFGIMIKQWVQDEKAADADWLIGEDCIVPGVKGISLRSMKAPGTAYNDPRFVSRHLI